MNEKIKYLTYLLFGLLVMNVFYFFCGLNEKKRIQSMLFEYEGNAEDIRIINLLERKESGGNKELNGINNVLIGVNKIERHSLNDDVSNGYMNHPEHEKDRKNTDDIFLYSVLLFGILVIISIVYLIMKFRSKSDIERPVQYDYLELTDDTTPEQ
jgi:hypothetical protein